MLGFGSIGQEVARRAHGVRDAGARLEPAVCETAAGSPGRDARRSRRRPSSSHPRKSPSGSDILSVHLALTDDTRSLVGASILNRLKPGSYFINTARGGDRRSRGAGRGRPRPRHSRRRWTCFAQEPAASTGEFSDPLVDLPNVYGTHHIGASTDQAQEAIAAEAVRDRFARTRTPARCRTSSTSRRKTPATHMLVVRHRDRPGRAGARVRSSARRQPERPGDGERHLRRRRGRRRAHQSRRKAAGRPAAGNRGRAIRTF